MERRLPENAPSAHEEAHVQLRPEERAVIEREIEAFSAAVAERMRLLEEAYWKATEAVKKADAQGLDPLKDPSAREAYLELQAIQGELEEHAQSARAALARVRAESGL